VQIYNKETLSKGGCLEICYGHKLSMSNAATDAPVKSLTTKALPFWLQALD